MNAPIDKPLYMPTLFGRRLREVREALRMSRPELCRHVLVSPATLRNIEQGYSPLGPGSPRKIVAALNRLDPNHARFVAEALVSPVAVHLKVLLKSSRKTAVQRVDVTGGILDQANGLLGEVPLVAVQELVAFSRLNGGRGCITIEVAIGGETGGHDHGTP